MLESIYDQIRKTGCKTSSWQSNFYFEKTTKTQEIVREYNNTHRGVEKITTFIDNIDKKPWYEANFMYDPYWQRSYRR